MTVCRIIRTGNLQTGWALECNRQLIRTHPSAAVLGAYLDAILAGVNEYGRHRQGDRETAVTFI